MEYLAAIFQTFAKSRLVLYLDFSSIFLLWKVLQKAVNLQEINKDFNMNKNKQTKRRNEVLVRTLIQEEPTIALTSGRAALPMFRISRMCVNSSDLLSCLRAVPTKALSSMLMWSPACAGQGHCGSLSFKLSLKSSYIFLHICWPLLSFSLMFWNF